MNEAPGEARTGEGRTGDRRRQIRRAVVLFLALSAFMYLSITYKIINYGP